MVDEPSCPRCGAALLGAGGSCFRCLLALGLETAGPSGHGGAAEDAPSGLPESVGPYRIVDLLARGEAGSTYLGEGTDGRHVVLRVLDRPGDPRQALARLEAERERLAAARHPGLVHAVDAGTTRAGSVWLAADWVPGVPITEYCDREHLSPRCRLEVLAEVCEAMGHAHARGLAHLGLTPSRVLVADESGPRARVVGFGVTRALGRRPDAQVLFSGRRLLEGTLGYLSPEELDPEHPDLDARTDVYALGALLHELMVGAPPFETRWLLRAGWEKTTRLVRDETPAPLSRRAARLPPSSDVVAQRGTDPHRLARELRGDVDWIASRALEKDPRRRYASAGELARDLRRVLDGEPVAPGLRSVGLRVLRVLGR